MALRVCTFTSGLAAENAYLVENEDSGEALIVDPGEDTTDLLDAATGAHVIAILVTHGHFDHIAGLAAVRRATGAPIYAPRREAAWLTDPNLNLSSRRAPLLEPITGPAADHLIEAGVPGLKLGADPIEVRHVPGHTPGHLVYLLSGCLFAGDTVFAGTVARTDLPEGDPRALARAIRSEILTLPDGVRLFPGHGAATTIGAERRVNPYLQHLPNDSDG